MKKIILGEWDGQPIWRWQTAAEQLIEAVFENLETKKNNEQPHESVS